QATEEREEHDLGQYPQQPAAGPGPPRVGRPQLGEALQRAAAQHADDAAHERTAEPVRTTLPTTTLTTVRAATSAATPNSTTTASRSAACATAPATNASLTRSLLQDRKTIRPNGCSHPGSTVTGTRTPPSRYSG